MAIRNTRQHIEVLGPGAGKARVTRQFIEVLGVGGTSIEEAVSDTLSMAQSVTVNVAYARTVSQSVGLSDLGEAGQEFLKSVVDTLTLTQTLRSNLHSRSVADALAIVQAVDVRGPIYVSIAQTMSLSQPFVEHLGVVNRQVLDQLFLTDTAGRSIPVSVSQTITLTQTGQRTNSVIDVLNLSQVALGGKGATVAQSLAMVSTVGLQAILSRALADSILIFQSVTYLIEKPGQMCQYSPFVGSSSDPEYTPPSTVPPVLGSATLTLTHPFVTPTTTLILRNPNFGNRDRLNFNTINTTTRGGTLVVFADPQWPKTQTLELQISGLKAQQAADLRAFLSLSIGQEIGLKDHENRQWRGVILNPDTPIAQPGRSNRAVTLQFQGVLA